MLSAQPISKKKPKTKLVLSSHRVRIQHTFFSHNRHKKPFNFMNLILTCARGCQKNKINVRANKVFFLISKIRTSGTEVRWESRREDFHLTIKRNLGKKRNLSFNQKVLLIPYVCTECKAQDTEGATSRSCPCSHITGDARHTEEGCRFYWLFRRQPWLAFPNRYKKNKHLEGLWALCQQYYLIKTSKFFLLFRT